MNKITILDYYLEQNKNKSYVDEYQSTAKKKSGSTFWHTNVNFRSIFSFVEAFLKFIKYDNKDRKEWEVYKNNNEQKAKQWTVRMQQSKFFQKDKEKGTYKLTAKGFAFENFANLINDSRCTFKKNEEWIIIFYFILNAYFDLKPNYILKKSIEIYNTLIINGFSRDYINYAFLDLLKKSEKLKKVELFKMDAFWILTFYKDKSFLELYREASNDEKMKLFDYVIQCSNLTKSEIIKHNDLISKKYVSGGQYTVGTFVDDVKTLFVAYNVYQNNNVDCFSLLENIFTEVKKFDCKVNYGHLVEFVEKNKDVFEVVFNEAILNKNIDTELNDLVDIEEEFDSDISNDKVDDTTIKNQKQLRRTSQILKRIAKEKNKFHCELETLNRCKYFTSKENNKNYLEIHHLIPFEFSNEFEASLEVIENYVALCPHCHRLLHFGVDRERKTVLTYLFNDRVKKLEDKNIKITLEELLAFYGFDENE